MWVKFFFFHLLPVMFFDKTNVRGKVADSLLGLVSLRTFLEAQKNLGINFGDHRGNIRKGYISLTEPVYPGLFYKQLRDSFIHSLLTDPFPPNLHSTFTPKSCDLGTCNFDRNFTSLHVSHVTCQVSCVTFHVSHVMCHMSPVICRMSSTFFFL